MAKKPLAAESHPELHYQLLGVAMNLREVQAELRREWAKCFAQPFPGWSRDALAAVASFAGLPADDVDQESFIVIYRKAIEKKQAATLTPPDARNKFCFEQWQSGKTLKEIFVALKDHPEWEQFEDEKSMRSARDAWGKRIGETPRKGQPGRRAKA